MRAVLTLFVATGAILGSSKYADAGPTAHWVDAAAVHPVAPGKSCTIAGYTTIQAAINAANPGDTVAVCPGTYVENVAINKASLTVRSTGGAKVTTIKPATKFYVVMITQPNVTFDGFTVALSGVTKPDVGVNVAIEGDASAEIMYNLVTGGRIGINLGCSSSGSTVYHNVVNGASEAGINIDTCEYSSIPGSNPGSNYNSVHHNTVCGGIYPYSIAAGDSSNYNHVHHNRAIWITGYGAGNILNDNVASVFNIWPGNIDVNNLIAGVCP